MSEPNLSPEEALAAARARVAGMASQAGGNPEAAGVYGDPAGRAVQDAPQSQAEVAQGLASSGGKAADVDVDALLAAIKAQSEQLAALTARVNEAAPVPEPVPPSKEPKVDNNAPGWMHSAFAGIHDRISVIEDALGL